MSNFVNSADSRETSRELMVAILAAAGDDEALALDIWGNGPDEIHLGPIVEIVTKNGMYETTDFTWGAAGTNWADEAIWNDV